MTQAKQFIAVILQSPGGELATSFHAALKAANPLDAVGQFFKQQSAYAACTLPLYLLALSAAAQTPAAPSQPQPPLDKATYSLSTLVQLLGGTWPKGFPDITVAKFSCSTANQKLDLQVEIDLDTLPAKTEAILHNFGSLFSSHKLLVDLQINYAAGLNTLGTRLSLLLDTLDVPLGGSTSLAITKPTATLDITPLFQFVVFTITGTIPFSVWQKQFDANLSMTIDNMEANVGVVIDSADASSLPALPVMRGLHFDEFGVGIGVFFEPVGGSVGLSGKFHIGETTGPNVVALDEDNDKFVLVCRVEGEVPTPAYLSFYVPKLDFNQAVTLFTNAPAQLGVPATFNDLSFKWSEDLMAPVVLPDGSLSSPGYGFSAALHLLSFQFFGDVQLNLSQGLTANIEMSPLNWANVFKLTGDGKGVTIKVDQSGAPIRNNQLATTQAAQQAQQQALKTATDQVLASPGGPVLQVQTLPSPLLHLNARVSLFEVEEMAVMANVDTTGILFDLGFDGVLTEKMSCTLADFHNLKTDFKFGINESISLPTVAGVSLGSLALNTTADAHLALSTSTSSLVLTIGGSFSFEGLGFSFGDYTLDANIQKLSDVLSAALQSLEQDAENVFGALLTDAATWGKWVGKGLVTGVTDVADALKTAFSQGAADAALILQSMGTDVNDIAAALKNTFGLSASDAANVLKNTCNVASDVATTALKQAGYAVGDIASALNSVYGLGASSVQQILGGLSGAEHAVESGIGSVISGIGGLFG